MKYLLDTHTWIWWHMQPRNLSAIVTKLIDNEDKYDEMLLSAISPWEVANHADPPLQNRNSNQRDRDEATAYKLKVNLNPINIAINILKNRCDFFILDQDTCLPPRWLASKRQFFRQSWHPFRLQHSDDASIMVEPELPCRPQYSDREGATSGHVK